MMLFVEVELPYILTNTINKFHIQKFLEFINENFHKWYFRFEMNKRKYSEIIQNIEESIKNNIK